MKKTIIVSFVIFACLAAFAIGPVKQTEVHEFDSIPMLDKFYVEEESTGMWDSVTVSLITLSQDDPLYSWFGHTGLLVETPFDMNFFYDYGRFAFSKSFYINFVKGILWFGCGCFDADYVFLEASVSKRTVSKVELNLTAEQKAAIVHFLDVNTSEPYDRYLYNHFYDNCATRIRDIINYATHGDFEAWAKSQKGVSCRKQTSRILYRNVPVEWVLDLLQGPSVDTEATLWEEMFLPENLEKGLIAYGKLGTEISYIEDFRATEQRPPVKEMPQNYVLSSLIAGIVIALIAVVFAKVCPTVYVVETEIINFVPAILGIILFYMMFFSGHSFAWNNENILFANPLLLLVAILGIKYKKHSKVLTVLYGLLTAVTAVMVVIKLVYPSLLIQDNMPQLAALLPYFMANTAVCLIQRKKLN